MCTIKKTGFLGYLSFNFLMMFSSPTLYAMTPLNDHEMSDATGQAAFYTTYTAPSGSGTGATASDYGFFKLGLTGTVQLNANIDHLQLGCGGVNGAGCDIDINNLSLSGISDGGSGLGHYATTTSRAATDAFLTNPFLQLAIQNPTSLSTRQVVGVNFGVASMTGLLTAGTSNSTSLNGASTSPTGVGINTLSGYMNIASATGTASTAPRTMTYSDTNQSITGNISTTTLGGCSILNPCIPFSTNNYSFNIGSASVPITTNPTTVNGTRLTSVQLSGTGLVSSLPLNGSMTATATLLFIPIPVTLSNVSGNVTNLGVNLTVNEGLSYIHSIPFNNNSLSLSLQSVPLLWPGSPSNDIAQRGWWLGAGGTINIGNITPSAQVAITNNVLAQTIPAISTYLTNNPVNCGLLATSCLVNAPLNLGNIDLTGTSVNFPLTNLTLSAQTPVPNCYGGLKFC